MSMSTLWRSVIFTQYMYYLSIKCFVKFAKDKFESRKLHINWLCDIRGNLGAYVVKLNCDNSIYCRYRYVSIDIVSSIESMLYRLRLRASDVELSLQSFCACHMRVCVSYDTSFTNSRTVYYDCNQIFVRNAFFLFYFTSWMPGDFFIRLARRKSYCFRIFYDYSVIYHE